MLSFKFASISLRSAASLNIVSSQLVSNVHQERYISSTSDLNQKAVPKLSARKIQEALSESQVELPPKPKKPVTPWIAFMCERKDDAFIQNGNHNVGEMTSTLAREWRNLVDKSKYEEDYRSKRDQYLKQLADYRSKLTEEQRDFLNIKRRIQRQMKGLRDLRKTCPPTLPRNARNLYVMDRCKDPEIKEQLKLAKSSKILGSLNKEYSALPEHERSKYILLQEKDKLRYKKEFAEWFSKIESDEGISKEVYEQASAMKARLSSLNHL